MPFDPNTAVLDEAHISKFDPSTAVIDIAPSKDILDIAAGGSPEDFAKQGRWVASGIQQTGKDLMTIPAHFFNQLLFNYPRYTTEKAGFNYPEKAQSPVAQKLAYGAGVVGGIKNPITKMMGIPGTLGKAATQGAILGAVYAPEDTKTLGEDVKARAVQAGMGAGFPMAGKFVGKAVSSIPKASRFMSGRIINSLIKPLGKDFSYGKNPGIAVASEGIVANNFDELAQKIADKRIQLGQNIKSVLTSPNNSIKRIDIEDSLNPLDAAMADAAEKNNSALLSRLQKAKSAITDKLRLVTNQSGEQVIQSTGKRNLSNLTPAEATEIKSLIGQMTQWTGNPSDDKLVNKAFKQSYGIIKNRIGDAVPEVKGLNERFANMMSAEVAVNHREQILQRQNMIGLAPRIVGGTGAIYGLATGNPGVMIASIATIGIDKILESPASRTRLAAGLNKLSKADLGKVIDAHPAIQSLISKSGNILKDVIDEPYFSEGTIRRINNRRGSIPIPFAKEIDMPVNLPKNNEFHVAIKNTPGAEITPDGLVVDTLRFQNPDQSGEKSIRTGVFYLLDKNAPQKRYYSSGKLGYGGKEKIEGKTLLKNPIFVKAGTGGRGPELAYDLINGKGAYQKMRSDVLNNAWTKEFNRKPDYNSISRLLEKYGGAPDLTEAIVENSKVGNTLPYAIQEHIVASSVRNSGYDSVLSYSKSRNTGEPFLSELFDVREVNYPTIEGDFTIHDKFLKSKGGQQ